MLPARRRLVFFSAAILAALTAILTVALPAGIASAATVTASGNRVWAISSAAQDHAGTDRGVSADQHQGEAAWCPFYAPGACVAPEADTTLVDGANGALRDPATGRFASNPDRVPPAASDGLHGNSRASTVTNWLYRRVSSDGTFQKWGITGDLKGRYSPTLLGDDQLIPMISGTRSEMLNLERWLVENDPGPMNNEPWAGSGG